MADLTADQIRLLALLADGHTDQSLARLLNVVPTTVRNRLRVIHDKLGTHNRAHAVAVAYRRGYLITDRAAGERQRLAQALDDLAARLRASANPT